MTSKKGTRRTRKKRVEISCYAPEAQSLNIAGSFNDWDLEQTPMKKDEAGYWLVSLLLPKGRHEYRFVADGHWFSDQQADDSAPNPHGSHNSILVVA